MAIERPRGERALQDRLEQARPALGAVLGEHHVGHIDQMIDEIGIEPAEDRERHDVAVDVQPGVRQAQELVAHERRHEAADRAWIAAAQRLDEVARGEDRIVGESDSARFHYDRTRLIDSVGREAQKVIDTYDRRKEARELADSARNAVATAAAVSAGAIGLGAIVTIAATTAAADVTGIIMASVVAAIGFFILPAKREKAKEEMRRKIGAVREKLSVALKDQFAKEIGKSGERIRESIAPYSRFIRAEGEKLRTTELELKEIGAELASLRARIDKRAA